MVFFFGFFRYSVLEIDAVIVDVDVVVDGGGGVTAEVLYSC